MTFTSSALANAVPQINQPLVPDSTAPGGAAFTLTVNGAGFLSGSVIKWNGLALTTSFVSSNQLTATVPADHIATAGTASVNVFNPTPGGGISNVVFFTITNFATSVFFGDAPGSPIADTGTPHSVAVGDFNGDGKPDLAIADYNNSIVIILLGNGNGTFTPAPSPATGLQPNSVSVGDFNGDGKIDLAVVNTNGRTVTILLGNGNGTFTPAAPSPATGVLPFSGAVGDFNGDGKLDLAVANENDNNLTILMGNGDGTFTPAASPATDAQPFSVAVGDFNSDGKLDLAVANRVGTVTILLGNGDGTFTPAASPATGTTPESLAVGDFNGDGKLDLAVANKGSNSVTILLGNGDGTFTPTAVSPATPPLPRGVTVGDFNGDGKLDLAVASTPDTGTGHLLTILLGNGDGTFTPNAQSPATGNGQLSVAVGDFNGDGKLDVAVANASSSVSILVQVGPVTVNPTALSFGNQAVSTASSVKNVTLTNNQGVALNISSIATTGDFSQTNTCTSPIAVGANCTISVTFTPSATGNRTGTLTINDDAAGSPQTVSLSGTGVNVAQLSSATLNFGNQAVSTTSGPRNETLTNFGSTPIAITSITASGDYAQTNTCGAALAVGATCNIAITFTPTTTGGRPGAITISDSAPLSPQTINLTGNGITAGSVATTCPATPALAELRQNYGNLPLVFEANLGQTDSQVKFLARGRGYGLFLTGDEAVLLVEKASQKSKVKSRMSKAQLTVEEQRTKDKGQGTTDSVLRMQLANANADAKVSGVDELPGRSNYFIGNDPAKWVKHAPTYAKVRYQDVYPGIDLVYYGNQRQLEYDFVVKPGADPKTIALALENGNSKSETRIATNGDLLIETSGGEIRLHKPLVYQEKTSVVSSQSSDVNSQLSVAANNGPRTTDKGQRTALEGRYVLTADNRVSIEVGAYDKTRPLIIDPVLSYSTYLGGSGDDAGIGIAVDASCNAYVTGGTTSIDFPTSATAKQTTFGGNNPSCGGPFDCGDAFVTKLSPDGTALVYSTYLGGNGGDGGAGIAVDSSGNAYVVGRAGFNFPTTAGGYQTVDPCSSDAAFVSKLSPDGSSLLYSSYLGGCADDRAAAVAVDNSGNAYLAGKTSAPGFPHTAGAYQTVLQCHTSNCRNAFVSKINTIATGTASLVYSTYLGGNVDDVARGIAIDASGNAYVTGSTLSTNFPMMNAFQLTFGGGGISCPSRFGFVCGDAFLTELNATGTALLYSTYLGGSGEDAGAGIAVDSSGFAYVTGGTDSSDFPAKAGAFQTVFGGSSVGCANTGFACGDGFVAKFDTTMSGAASRIYSTYLGGPGDDITFGIAVDATGSAYVAGTTNSSPFVETTDATQGFFGGGTHPCTVGLICGDAFVVKLDPSGSSLAFSTYLGGSGDDGGFGLALDSAGNAYVTGITASTDFPHTATAFQTTFGGGVTDAFVAKIAGLNVLAVTFSPTSVAFGNQIISTTSSAQIVTLTNTGTSGVTISTIGITGDFAQTNACPVSPAILAAKASCTITVTFTPSGFGSRTGTISVADSVAGSPQTVALSGIGVSGAVVSFSPTSLTFGSLAVGTTSPAQTVTLTNTGTGTLGIASIASTTTDFTETNTCGATLAPSSSCTISVSFAPVHMGTLFGSIQITDDAAGSPHSFALSGTGLAPQIVLSPSSLAFDTRAVGSTSVPQLVTLTNDGTSTLNISSIVTTGDYAQTNTCGTTVAAGTHCTISVTFTPTVTGSRGGNVVINSDAFRSPATSLSISGSGFVTRLTPQTLSFVAQPVGVTSPVETAVFINTGTTPVTITSVTATGDFAQTNTCGTSVPAGGSCTISVTFTPTTTGSIGGSLTVVSSAPDSGGTLTMGLSGTGIVLRFAPDTLLFDNRGIGTTSPAQTVTLTNTGAAAISITSITTSAGFAETNTCGVSIAASSSCTISVTFSATSARETSGTLHIDSGAPDGSLRVALFATGEALQQSTRILFFGPQPTGTTSAAQTAILTNTGTTDLTSASVSATGDFAQTNTCGTTIAAGASCTVSVTFTPSAGRPVAGAPENGNLSVASSAATVTVTLFGNSPIVNAPGFTTNVLGPNDDSSTPMVPLPFTPDFFGNLYNGLFVNNNGNVTFDRSLGTFTPFDLSSTSQVIIAPFFADVYTSLWPAMNSGLVTYGTDTVGGHTAFGVNYFNVEYYSFDDKLNTFQVLLIDRSDIAPGDFDIEYNYNQVQWETGSASSGSDGLGGFSARAGFSNGTSLPGTSFEIPGSAVNGGLLDSNTTTGLINHSLGSPALGRYVLEVRAGGVVPPGFALSPSSLTFGSTAVTSSSSPQPVTVTNTGGSSLTISSITISGDFTQTSSCPASPATPATLAPGSSCTVNVVFTPTATGARTGTLTFSDSAAGSPQTVSLSGTGTGGSPAVTLSATSLHLPDTHVHQICHSGTVTISSTGGGPLTISSISASGPFTQTNTCPLAPATLAAGAICTVAVTFVPTTVGDGQSGTLSIASNAPSTPDTVALAGNGKAPCLVVPSVRSVTVLRGADTATFSLQHQTGGAEAEDPLHLYCMNQAPASCAFNPGSIGPMGVATLTLSNLKALNSGSLLFDVHGDATFDKHTTGLTVLLSDFGFTSAPDTATIAAGQAASYAVVVAPQNGLAGTVALACSGAPAGATCSVTPGTVSLTGTAPASVTVTVSTTARSLAAPPSAWRVLPLGGNPIGLIVLAMLGLLTGLFSWKLAGEKSRTVDGMRSLSVRRSLSSMRLRLASAGAGLTIAMVLAWGACGGGGPLSGPTSISNATPAGTYSLTVTGTYSGAPASSTQLSHSTALKLTVN